MWLAELMAGVRHPVGRYEPFGAGRIGTSMVGWEGEDRPAEDVQARSNRSRFMTLFHAVTKSRTNVSLASPHA
jgi:hypothetical protein